MPIFPFVKRFLDFFMEKDNAAACCVQPPEPSLAPEADYNRMFKSLQRCAECPHRLKVILVGLVCAAISGAARRMP